MQIGIGELFPAELVTANAIIPAATGLSAPRKSAHGQPDISD
jgi:hypothetical protein